MRFSQLVTATALISSVLISNSAIVKAAPLIANHLIHISVDGLRSDAITTLGAATLPNFYHLRLRGAYTDNARTDVEQTITLPNHTSQITGRHTGTEQGHNYTSNGIPGSASTLHRIKGKYINSVFDVIHDTGSSTALFASKPKFVLYAQSYDESNGAADVLERDNGRNKIDLFAVDPDTSSLVDEFLTHLLESRVRYAFLHLRDPDTAGHLSNWDLNPGSDYLNSIINVDTLLGKILTTIEAAEFLRDKTAIILTSDHGGRLGTIQHEPADDPENYVIPFYVWGAGVARGVEIYSLNMDSRLDPKLSQPSYSSDKQPIRNGDSANLALQLLGLESIPGSIINAKQDLRIH